MEKTYLFHISGMHYKACVMLSEEELQDHPKVVSAATDMKTRTVRVTGDFGDASPEEVALQLTAVLEKHGYALSVEAPERKGVKWDEFAMAIPMAAVLVGVFVLLQKIGIIDLVDTSRVTYGTAFMIGAVASLSTCMAMVGGLLLSMSATFAKEREGAMPHILFHVARIIAFFVLGGVIGTLGSSFHLGASGIFGMSFVVGVVMLLLGLNLLDTFRFSGRFQLTLPMVFSQKILGATRTDHVLTPALIGVATFFLPCGFTQSMQLYALSTGSFLQGGLTMLFFALGTFPVLALISIGSTGIGKKPRSGTFFKTAGIIVILFALFNIINSFVAIGLLSPVFDF